MANQRDPSPEGARVANSPNAGAMRRPYHTPNVSRAVACVKPSRRSGMARRIETRTPPVPNRGTRANTEAAMDDGRRIVESPSRARQAAKYGVVRYVLAISLVLVVIAFAVAYMTSV
jgi:hypothetical protein